jgi:hypothetical protein
MEKLISLDFVCALLDAAQVLGWHISSKDLTDPDNDMVQAVEKAQKAHAAMVNADICKDVAWLAEVAQAFLPYLAGACIDCGEYNRRSRELFPQMVELFVRFGIELPYEKLLEHFAAGDRCFQPGYVVHKYFQEVLGLKEGQCKFEKNGQALVLKVQLSYKAPRQNLELFEKLLKERGIPLEIA